MPTLSNRKHLLWLDIIRGLAILWIFLVHFVERFMCCPLFANPSAQWPPITYRFSQLAPLDIDGIEGVIVNFLRYLGWAGDQGVQIFLVASGFALTVSALSKTKNIPYQEFFRRRLSKLLPLWIVVHLLFIVTFIILEKGLSPSDWRTWLSLLGFRFLPEVFSYKFPSWWFIGLLFQLYLFFPCMLYFLKRWNLLRFFLVFCGLSILVRLIGLLTLEEYLNWWSRGGFFITRLPEFAFGMVFAKWFVLSSDQKKVFLFSPIGVACTLGTYVIGNICSFFLTGMAVAFFLTGASFFVLVFIIFSRWHPKLTAPISWLGQRSYSVFLIHHPILLFLVPTTLSPEAGGKVLLYLIVSLLLSICAGQIIENISIRLFSIDRQMFRKTGRVRLVLRLSFLAILSIGILLGTEVLVRKFDPQEILGWGERPSLAPHPELGFNLQPNKSTRLRWLSYDYTVNANALGFPGKLYDSQKPKGTYRIFVTGDAYSSAEGVDTKKAWPRLLEKKLVSKGLTTEVMNFSITGWGPNQYAAVIDKFAPVYKPDLILISFFVNEFDDVVKSNEDFQRLIGFSKPAQDSIKSYIYLNHFRAWLKNHIFFKLREIILGISHPHGYFFGYFRALEKKQLSQMEASSNLIKSQLKSIDETSKELDIKVVVVLVPAPAQICRPEDVKYWPRNIDLNDSSRFDLEQPQRLITSVLDTFSLEHIDLREPLLQNWQLKPCQPLNLHWTEAGHRIVADYIVQYLSDNMLSTLGAVPIKDGEIK